MEKNKRIKRFNRKEFNLFKNEASIFSQEWLKVFFLYQLKKDSLKTVWSLSKKDIPFSVTRNRLKRWGRENLRKTSAKGLFLFVFLRREKGFYKKLSRRDFDVVFKEIMEKTQRKLL